MVEFTKEEIEREHRRRRHAHEWVVGSRDNRGQCIHCSSPIGVHGIVGEVNLCERCLYEDD